MKSDIELAVEKKNKSIKSFQDAKEDSMKLFASGRDATMLITAFHENYKGLSEENLRKKLLDWKLWFYVTFYDTDPDNQLRENVDVPF
jgi:hypothetical protein